MKTPKSKKVKTALQNSTGGNVISYVNECHATIVDNER